VIMTHRGGMAFSLLLLSALFMTIIVSTAASWLAPYSGCIKIVTCTTTECGSSHSHGALILEVDIGNGFTQVYNSYFDAGSTVLERCFTSFFALRVAGPNNDGWVGRIHFSTDGGVNFFPMVCRDCAGDDMFTSELWVDRDSSTTPITQCKNGKKCTIEVNPLTLTDVAGVRPVVIDCFSDGNDGFRGNCTAFVVDEDDSKLVAAGTITANPGSTDAMFTTPLSTTTAITCFRDGGSGWWGACVHVTLQADGTMTKGPKLYVRSHSSRSTNALGMTPDTALVCHRRDHSTLGSRDGKCGVLTVGSGGSLTYSSEDLFASGYVDLISLTRLSETMVTRA